MELLLGAALAIAIVIGGYILMAKGLWDLLKQLLRSLGLLRPLPQPATAEQIEEVKQLLEELKSATPEGAAEVSTDALAAAATERTAGLLREAIELQTQHREREAIDVLLEAFQRDLPPEARADLHRLIGNSFLNLTELEEAEGHFRQSLEASRTGQFRLGEASALGSLGVVYGQRGDFDHAEQYCQDALVILREVDDRLNEARSLGNLGIIYDKQGDLKRAEQFHREALDLSRTLNNRMVEANALGNLGNVYSQQGDIKRAEQYHLEALSIDRVIGNRLGEAHDLGNLGNVYDQQDDLERAEQHYREALEIDRAISNRLSEANQLGNLALIAGRLGDFPAACARLREALAIFEQVGAVALIEQTQHNLAVLGCNDDTDG